MSGYCPDCGNTLCLCDEVTKATYPYRVKLAELTEELKLTKDKLESCKYFWKTIMGKFERKYPDAGNANTLALTALTEAFDIHCENKELLETLKKIRDIDWGTDHCDDRNFLADDILTKYSAN